MQSVNIISTKNESKNSIKTFNVMYTNKRMLYIFLLLIFSLNVVVGKFISKNVDDNTQYPYEYCVSNGCRYYQFWSTGRRPVEAIDLRELFRTCALM